MLEGAADGNGVGWVGATEGSGVGWAKEKPTPAPLIVVTNASVAIRKVLRRGMCDFDLRGISEYSAEYHNDKYHNKTPLLGLAVDTRTALVKFLFTSFLTLQQQCSWILQ